MNVGLLYPPYTPVLSQKGAAPLHIAHMISILREECEVSNVKYVDFNMIPFYLYFLSVHELLKDSDLIKIPVHLLEEEKSWLLDRVVLENIFNVPENLRTNTFFNIDRDVVEGLQKILHKLLNHMINRVSILSMDSLLLFTSPNICYTLELIDLIRKKDANIPIMLLDNYTFEPATPYFASFITHKDYYGNDIGHFLRCDPLSPIMEKIVPDLVDWIIIGEGYDAVRILFNSNNPPQSLEGTFFSVGGGNVAPRKIVVDQNTPPYRANGVRIVRSLPVALNSLPLPDYGLMKSVYKSAEIEISRGCPYECVFCERSGMFGNAVRSHNLQYMDRLISHLQQYDFDFYTFIDSALNVDEKTTIQFLETLEGNTPFKYQANLRGKLPNEKLIELLKDTGCEEIAIGMETADDSVLNSMNKAQNSNLLKKLVRSISDHKLKFFPFLIVGFPTETLKSVNKTIDFIEHINSYSKIDGIEGELYHPGYIQKLTPFLYKDYGIKWKCDFTVQNIERSSRLFTEPGLFGLAHFTRGMNRFQLNEGIKRYIYCFTQLGIQYFICPSWRDDHEICGM